jgi:hypothetical protein
MNMKLAPLLASLLAPALLTACVENKPYDYSRYRAHRPRSVLVLPPLNESTDVIGPYSYLSTVTQPLAELGYYVYPVAVVDQYLKDNGMPTAGEMHQIPLQKVGEVIGADAVLYITLQQYGAKYQLVSSNAVVGVRARMVDTHSGDVLWEGQALAQQSNNSSGNILADLIAAALTQVINAKTDAAHNVARQANFQLFMTPGHGLLYGPYNPKYQSD